MIMPMQKRELHFKARCDQQWDKAFGLAADRCNRGIHISFGRSTVWTTALFSPMWSQLVIGAYVYCVHREVFLYRCHRITGNPGGKYNSRYHSTRLTQDMGWQRSTCTQHDHR